MAVSKVPSRRTLTFIVLVAIVALLLLYTFPSPTSYLPSPPSRLLHDREPLLAHKATTTSPVPPPSSTAYRDHLELTTSLPSQIEHSETLTFSNIYVLSLPSRQDRRDQMTRLADALGLRITFVDAVRKDEPFIKWIAERAVEARIVRQKALAKARKVPLNSIGGLAIGTIWLTPHLTLDPPTPFPSPPSPSWIDTLETAYETNTLSTLVPSNPNLNITEALHDPLENIDGRQVNEGVISTFFGHTRAIKLMLQNGDESALILEDDVDVEWDLERLWSRIERVLPDNWEVSFLGHCWGRELTRPAYLHPLLHQSTAPLCLHAYALSSLGARNTLSLLQNPLTAYLTAVDTAMPSFIAQSQLTAFSVEPPLIIQRKDGPSDIQDGIGSVWKGLLMDSTVDRIKMDRGEEVVKEVWNPKVHDPATVFRYRKVTKNCR